MLKVETINDVIFVSAEGTITHDDYHDVLVPEVENQIQAHGAVRLLYWLGPGFKRFSAGAMWDDARFGLLHLGDFKKIAVVSDAEFIRASVKLFAPLISAPVKVFQNAEIEDAKRWITDAEA